MSTTGPPINPDDVPALLAAISRRLDRIDQRLDEMTLTHERGLLGVERGLFAVERRVAAIEDAVADWAAHYWSHEDHPPRHGDAA